MNQEQRNILKKHRLELVKDLELKDDLIDKFIHYRLFTEDTIEEIKSKPSRRERIQEILKKLPRKGPKAFDSFVLSIQDSYPWLAIILTEPDEITCPIQTQVDITVHEHFGNSRKLCEEDKKEIRNFLCSFLLTNSEKNEHLQSEETEAQQQVESFVHRHFGNSRRLSEEDKHEVRNLLCTILLNTQRENLDNQNKIRHDKMETRKRKYSIGDTANHTCVINHPKTQQEKQIETKIINRILKIIYNENLEVSLDANRGCSIETIEQSIAELVNKYKSAKQSVSEIETKYESLQNEVKDIFCILEKENCGSPNSLRQAFKHYKTERHSEFLRIKEELADVKEKLADVESQRYDLEKKLTATENELAATKQKLKESEQELCLNQSMNKLRTKIDSLDTTNADLKATNADLKASSADLKAAINQLSEKIDSMSSTHRPGTRQSLPPLTQRQSTDKEEKHLPLFPKLEATKDTLFKNGKSRQTTSMLRKNSILEQDISAFKANTRKSPWH